MRTSAGSWRLPCNTSLRRKSSSTPRKACSRSTSCRADAMRIPPAVLALLVVAVAGCKSDLNTHLSEADANEIMDVLYAENIPAVKLSADQTTWSIQIDE